MAGVQFRRVPVCAARRLQFTPGPGRITRLEPVGHAGQLLGALGEVLHGAVLGCDHRGQRAGRVGCGYIELLDGNRALGERSGQFLLAEGLQRVESVQRIAVGFQRCLVLAKGVLAVTVLDGAQALPEFQLGPDLDLALDEPVADGHDVGQHPLGLLAVMGVLRRRGRAHHGRRGPGRLRVRAPGSAQPGLGDEARQQEHGAQRQRAEGQKRQLLLAGVSGRSGWGFRRHGA